MLRAGAAVLGQAGWLVGGWLRARRDRRLDQVRKQDVWGREVEYCDGRADDGDVASSDQASVMRVPNDEEGEERTEQRREESEQQQDQRDHDQVGDVVGEARDLDLPPRAPAGGPAAVSIKISTA